MTDQRLLENQTGTADANGRAFVQLGEFRMGETWTVERMTVTSSSTVLVPTARVYRDDEIPTRLVDGTYTGTLDTSDVVVDLQSGEILVCVWTGADIGARCTLTIEGKRHLP